MDVELLLKYFETHPILVTFLILASMFFISVWCRGWPTSTSTEADDDEDENEHENEDHESRVHRVLRESRGTPVDIPSKDEEEKKNYSVNFQQIKINLNDHGLPKSIEGIMIIKKEEN